jgi:hypothetical protein
MYIAVCIAAGADFWGFKTQAGKVLYLNFELPRPFFRQRLAALCDAMGIVLKPGRLHTICMRGRAADGDLICFELRRLFAKAGYVAVIFDPVYKMQGVRNESSLGEMALLFNALEKVATEFNAAIFFANHYAKGIQGGKEPLDRVGGSRAFAADPDVIINLTKHKLHSDNLPLYVVDFTLRCAPPVNHCCVHWEYPLFVIDLEHDADDVKVEPVKKTQAQVREENEAGVLFKILLNSESPLSKTEWMEAAKLAGTDLHRTTFGRRVDALKEAGKIEPSGDGRWQSKID